MWDGPLGSIKAVQHWVEQGQLKGCSIHLASHWQDLRGTHPRQAIERRLAINNIGPSQTECSSLILFVRKRDAHFASALNSETERIEDTRLVSNKGHRQTCRLTGRRHHVFDFGCKLQILAGQIWWVRPLQNVIHLPSRLFSFTPM